MKVPFGYLSLPTPANNYSTEIVDGVYEVHETAARHGALSKTNPTRFWSWISAVTNRACIARGDSTWRTTSFSAICLFAISGEWLDRGNAS